MDKKLLWGIDLGGTKIECAVLEQDSRNILTRRRIATGQDKGYAHILDQLKKLVDAVAKELKSKPNIIGIGTPGTMDFESGKLKNSNTVSLNNKPLKEDLEKKLGVAVVLSNDANCFALAETKMGIVQEIYPQAEVVFGVIMGTGVGGGIVVNGKVLNGCHGIAGEWGHNYLDESGGLCYCGKTGCVETIISGTALQDYYEKLSSKKLTLAEIVKISAQDTHAQKTLDRLYDMFGKAIANVINILDPDLIVLGGGVGNIKTLISEGRRQILPHLFNPQLNTQIVSPKLGDSAGVFGAAMLLE